MRPVEESFSIVIVGSWNHRIFSENWVAEYLARDAASKVVLAFPIGDPNAPNRLEFEDTLMFASPGSIRLTPKVQTIEGLERCKETSIRLLETLSHTPVTAFGVNYRYQEEENLDEMWERAGFSSLFDEKPGLDMSLTGMAVNKQFTVRDGVQLNHKVSATVDNSATFDFNFHHGIEDAKSALELLQTDLVRDYYQNVKSVIRSYYDVDLPE